MTQINLELYNILKSDLGIEEAKAKAAAVLNPDDSLVTKADLRVALAELESRLVWKVIGAMVALTAIFSAIVKLT